MRSARAASSSPSRSAAESPAAAAAAAVLALAPSPSSPGAGSQQQRRRSAGAEGPPGGREARAKSCRARTRGTWLRLARIRGKGRHEAWIMDAIRGLYYLFNVSRVQNDGFVSRLHVLTAVLLLTFSAMVSMKQAVGNPIDCVHTRDIPVEAFNAYCWIHSTYFVTGAMLGVAGVNVAFPGVGSTLLYQQRQRERGEAVTRQIKYYQWVPFFLVFQI